MSDAHKKRANIIEGLPTTFNILFVIRSGKKCGLCSKRIKKEEIAKNSIVYTDEFEYVHKPCLVKKEIFYEHIRAEDFSSPVKLILSNKKSSKSKKMSTEDIEAI